MVFIFIFIGLISFPLTGKFLNFYETGASELISGENRNPHKYPEFPTSISKLKAFPPAFEDAFSDHLPFRNILIEIYSNLLLRLLKVSPHEQLLIGRNGHYFLASHLNRGNDLIFSSIQIDSQRIAQQTKYLSELEPFLQDLNVPVVLVAIPTSPIFNFYNLPLFIQKQIDPSILETPPSQRVIDNMNKVFAQNYLLFPYKQALEANNLYPLFPEKNFHWKSSRYTKLTASCIAEKFKIAPYEKPGFDEFMKEDTPSDLSGFAGTKLYNKDDLVYKNDIWKLLNIRDEKPEKIYKNYPTFPYCYYSVNPSKKGKILLVGDSFVSALRFDLARYFGEVLTVNFGQARRNPNLQDWLHCVFNDFQPNYIVFLSHEKFSIYKEFIEEYYKIESKQVKSG